MIYCRKCGARMKITNVFTASNQPKTIYDCPCCGNVQFSTEYEENEIVAHPDPVIKPGKVVSINLDKYDWTSFRRRMSVIAFKRLMSMEMLDSPKDLASRAVAYADEFTSKLKEGGSLVPGEGVQTKEERITVACGPNGTDVAHFVD